MAPPPDDCSSPPSRSVATVFTLPPRDLCPDQTSSRAISLYSGHSGQSSPPSLTQSAKPRPSLLTCDVRRPALSYFEPTRTRSLRVHEREEEIATATRAQQSDNVDSRGALEGGPDRSSHHCDSFESPSTRRRRLGWDHLAGESHQNGLLRGEVLLALTLLGHEITCKEAIRRFSTFLEDKNSPLLPPDIRKATYTAVMRSVTTADKSGMESLFDVYRNTDTGQEKERILSALASCPDPHIVLEALNFLLSVQVRDQDVIYGLAGISWEGSETAWSWLKNPFLIATA